MEKRLTDENGVALNAMDVHPIMSCGVTVGYIETGDVFKKLKAYEDLNKSPEEIENDLSVLKLIKKSIRRKCQQAYTVCDDDESVNIKTIITYDYVNTLNKQERQVLTEWLFNNINKEWILNEIKKS